MKKAFNFFYCNEWFPFFLCLFFILHVAVENAGVKLMGEALLLALEYLLACIFLLSVFWLVFKNISKASLFVFFIMAFNFFFGSLHDTVKKNFPGSFIGKYTVIVPIALVSFVFLGVYLLRSSKSFSKAVKFLNLLCALLIIIDTATLLIKLNGQNPPANFAGKMENCDSCLKPDIYLIITDEYAGKQELQDLFQFDNSSFEKQLGERGFRVLDNTKANYNATVYSMSSMLNMEYLDDLNSNFINERDMFRCRDLLDDNNTIRLLKNFGYSIYNYSFFSVDHKEPVASLPFFISKKKLFTSQTFLDRVKKDIGFHFTSSRTIDQIKRQQLFDNKRIDSLVRGACLKNEKTPKFVYAHLFMPHHPYVLDSNGNRIADANMQSDTNRKSYIGYLLFTNKFLLSLIDYIRKTSQRPTCILLMSDHGFRQFSDSTPEKYYFMNLNAVYLPDSGYSGFYNGMSNVNQFRVLFNTEFHQKFPLLKDSTIFLKE